MKFIIQIFLILCIVNVLGQEPVQVAKLSKQMNETSGLLIVDGKFYTFNDSGGEAELYQFDTISGEVIQTIKVENASNVDWEAVTADEEYIYIGDIGNNKGNRQDLVVYKCPISGLQKGKLISEKIQVSYEDQITFKNKSHQHEYDGESLFVKGDKLFLVSKNWAKDESKIYSVPKAPGNYVLSPEARILVYGKVTDAFYDVESEALFLIGYGDERFITALYYFNSESVKEVTIPIVTMHGLQTEGIAVYDYSVYYTSEEVKMFEAELSKFSLADFKSPIKVESTGDKLKIFGESKIQTIILEYSDGTNVKKLKDVNSNKKTINLTDINKSEQLYLKVKLKSGLVYRSRL